MANRKWQTIPAATGIPQRRQLTIESVDFTRGDMMSGTEVLIPWSARAWDRWTIEATRPPPYSAYRKNSPFVGLADSG